MTTWEELTGDRNEAARTIIKQGLSQLTESHRKTFRLMYSHENLETPVETIVDEMLVGKLHWCMQQVQRSLDEDAV